MYTLALLVTLVIVSLAAGFLRLRLALWSAALAVVLAGFSYWGSVSAWLLVPLWLLWAAVAIPLNYRPWRRRFITRSVLEVYRKLVPELSDTEATALEAGTVGWEGELFAGKPNFRRLLKQPAARLSEQEQAFLDGPVEQLCRMLDDWDITHRRADLSPEVWQHLKQHRFFGMIIPPQFGGLGFSAQAHSAVLQKIGGRSITAFCTVAVPNSLGPAELLLHYGTNEQKDYYLPRLAKGEEIPCFGLTGPTAGSDATSIPDVGIVCKGQFEGREVLGMRLTFDKRYITLAPVATVVGLAFQLKDPDGLLGEVEDIGISLALLPRATEGMDIGRRHFPLNIPFQNGPIRGRDVFVPLDFLIGGRDMAGQGWRMLVECLSVGRAISLPSSATGGMKAAAMATGAYARMRKQFNLPIGRFEGVEEALARIGGYTYAGSALSEMTAIAVDAGEKPAVPSAIAKYHTTEMGRQVAADSMDIHGGKGVILGPRNYIGRGWQAAPISITVEGANIMTRSLMIFGQGAVRCHPYVLKEMASLKMSDGKAALKAFDQALFGHIGMAISNACRALLLGLTGGRLSAVPGARSTRPYFRAVARYSAALGLVADLAMLTLGGKLKFKERLSARLGDVLSQLYIVSAMLKRFEDQQRPHLDVPLLHWACQDAVHKMQTALDDFIANFPIRPMAWLMRLMVFPIGTWDGAPRDRLGHKVAALLLSPNEARTRLTRFVYDTDEPGNPIGMMEALLPEVIRAEPLERKLQKAARSGQISPPEAADHLPQAVKFNVLSEEERALVERTRAAVAEVVAVDEFDSDELAVSTAAAANDRQAAA